MRRTAARRPIRLTESRLRQIIRETIEEELIQEGVMSKELKQAALAALAALGIASTPAALADMYNAISDAVNTKAVHSAHIDSLEGQEGGLNRLARSEKRSVTQHPTLKSAAQQKHDSHIKNLRAKLKKQGLSDNEINKKLKVLINKDEMYSGN